MPSSVMGRLTEADLQRQSQMRDSVITNFQAIKECGDRCRRERLETRFIWEESVCYVRCYLSWGLREREVGVQGNFSDNLLFVPHNLGDTSLRKRKILVAAAYKEQSINCYMVRAVTSVCGLFLLICWWRVCVSVCVGGRAIWMSIKQTWSYFS